MLHEMAHAYHQRVLGFNNQPIREAFDNALELDLWSGQYASENYIEYFAELTAAIYNKKRSYPKNRYQLLDYDSLGYSALSLAWLP